jgi:hypothetical protein
VGDGGNSIFLLQFQKFWKKKTENFHQTFESTMLVKIGECLFITENSGKYDKNLELIAKLSKPQI